MLNEGISIGAVGAALIAALVSFISLIIAKENKTSEFRQQWIDSLRQDISDAISSLAALSIMGHVHLNADNAALISEKWRQAAKSLALIELRINILEDDHLELLSQIRDAEVLIKRSVQGEDVWRDLDALQGRVMEISHRILKREWDRVKAGEATFQLTKYALMLGMAWAILQWAY